MDDKHGARREPLADKVYGILLAQLMDGSREPGEQLNIVTLSGELAASQTPIREALARLEHTGLVRREALKGYRVAPLFSEQELVKLMDARLALEPAMAGEAGRRLTPEFLDELLETIEDLGAVAEEGVTKSFHAYWSADERFHGLIAKQMDNPFLETAYRSLGGQVQRFRLFVELGSTDARYAAREHRAIYDAFVAGDAQGANERMRDHVEAAKTRSLNDRKTLRASA
jgi:DNA-binding GntR family transcriptional regulator